MSFLKNLIKYKYASCIKFEKNNEFPYLLKL